MTTRRNRFEALSEQILALAVQMREGFARVDRRLDRIDGRLEEVIDITHRTYNEHGRRLADIEAQLSRNAEA